MPYKKMKYIFLPMIIMVLSCNVITIDNESPRYKIYSGNYGIEVIYRVENNKVYSGNYDILYRIENNKIYSEDYELIYRIDENKIYQSCNVIYRIENNKVYSGSYGYDVVYRIVEY
jgi:hypothetical protein